MRQIAFTDMTDDELAYIYKQEADHLNTPSGVPSSGFIYSNYENARKEMGRRAVAAAKDKPHSA